MSNQENLKYLTTFLGYLDTLHDFCGARNDVVSISVIKEFARTDAVKEAYNKLQTLPNVNKNQIEALYNYKSFIYSSFEHNILEFVKNIITEIDPDIFPNEEIYNIGNKTSFTVNAQFSLLHKSQQGLDTKIGYFIDTSLISDKMICDQKKQSIPINIIETTASIIDKEGKTKNADCTNRDFIDLPNPYGLAKDDGELMGFYNINLNKEKIMIKPSIRSNFEEININSLRQMQSGVKVYSEVLKGIYERRKLSTNAYKVFKTYHIDTGDGAQNATIQARRMFDIKRLGDWGQIAVCSSIKEGLNSKFFVTIDRPAVARSITKKVDTILTTRDKEGYKITKYGNGNIILNPETKIEIIAFIDKFFVIADKLSALNKENFVSFKEKLDVLISKIFEEIVLKSHQRYVIERKEFEAVNAIKDIPSMPKIPVYFIHNELLVNLYCKILYSVKWYKNFIDSDNYINFIRDIINIREEYNKNNFKDITDDQNIVNGSINQGKELLKLQSKINTIFEKYNIVDYNILENLINELSFNVDIEFITTIISTDFTNNICDATNICGIENFMKKYISERSPSIDNIESNMNTIINSTKNMVPSSKLYFTSIIEDLINNVKSLQRFYYPTARINSALLSVFLEDVPNPNPRKQSIEAVKDLEDILNNITEDRLRSISLLFTLSDIETEILSENLNKIYSRIFGTKYPTEGKKRTRTDVVEDVLEDEDQSSKRQRQRGGNKDYINNFIENICSEFNILSNFGGPYIPYLLNDIFFGNSQINKINPIDEDALRKYITDIINTLKLSEINPRDYSDRKKYKLTKITNVNLYDLPIVYSLEGYYFVASDQIPYVIMNTSTYILIKFIVEKEKKSLYYGETTDIPSFPTQIITGHDQNMLMYPSHLAPSISAIGGSKKKDSKPKEVKKDSKPKEVKKDSKPKEVKKDSKPKEVTVKKDSKPKEVTVKKDSKPKEVTVKKDSKPKEVTVKKDSKPKKDSKEKK